jgi:amidophosphoribosyltransferase
MGYVADVFSDEVLAGLQGHSAIGHVRYSTTGHSHLENAQPILIDSWRGPIALAHNGNLINTEQIRKELEEDGAIFQSTTDTEVILHLLARCQLDSLEEALFEVLRKIHGAFSMVLQTPTKIWAIRDPHGVRPLSLAQMDGSWVVASETCAFDLIGATHIRDVQAGEAVKIEDGRLHSVLMYPSTKQAACVFEHVYFSRPDSRVFGKSVHETRYSMGVRLADEAPVDADLVVPVPDSGVTAALGFADHSGIPFQFGLIRNHYVGRTFIEPKQSIRHFGVKIKLNPVKPLLQGRRVVLIDDSIVRGTTSRKIVEMVRSAGAKEVHLRISSPPTVSPCHYGIDTPTHDELIGNQKSIEKIREFTGADSLAYLTLEGLKASVTDQGNFCMACFDRSYPIPIEMKSPQKLLFDAEETAGS